MPSALILLLPLVPGGLNLTSVPSVMGLPLESWRLGPVRQCMLVLGGTCGSWGSRGSWSVRLSYENPLSGWEGFVLRSSDNGGRLSVR